MATQRHRILISFTPEERARVDALSAQLRLSRSELMRRLVLAQRLPKPEDFVAYQGIRDLLKVNADLARLGNLFKLAIDEAPENDLVARLGALATDMAETQETLKACARAIHALVKRTRS